jgi:predicted MFS family arabinose efflux permease
VILMVAFVRRELRTQNPLLDLRIFRDRAFAVDNAALGLMSIVFVPFFFFASVYAQISLGKSASNAGVYLLYFFIGFVVMAQVGGRVLDRRGARPAVVIGSAIAAVGFYLLAGKMTDLSLGAQTIYIIIAGGGVGLMLGPASTDAVNRAPSAAYSEVTGITQTARNFGASLGLAVLGTILIESDKTNVTHALSTHGVPAAKARQIAASFGSGSPSGSSSSGNATLHHAVALATAQSSQTVFYVMAGVMAATFLMAVRWYPRGRTQTERAQAPDATPLGTGVADAV